MNETKARRIVSERSGGVCEVQLSGVCQGRAGEWHHRRNRSQGGTWEPSNGLHLCSGCHRWITEHPAESYDEGWMLRAGHWPESTPVRTWHGYLLLDDAGDWTNLGFEKPLVEHAAGCEFWSHQPCDCGGVA